MRRVCINNITRRIRGAGTLGGMAPVTSVHVALFGVLITALAINTTRYRVRGGREPDAHTKEMTQRASRAHGNTLEHGMPVLLILLCTELNGGSAAWIGALGAVFLISRVSYAYGMITRPVSPPMRIGAGLTYLVEIVAINYLIAQLLC